MKSPNDVPTTKPETAPPTNVENERPEYEHNTRRTSSAAMLVLSKILDGNALRNVGLESLFGPLLADVNVG